MRIHHAIIYALLATLAVTQRPACGAEQTLEMRVKAAFVLNFIQFTGWPAGTFSGPKGTVVIGVLDPDPLGGALETTVQGKRVNGREIQVKHFASMDRIEPCHVLCVGDAYKEQVGAIVKKLDGAPTLTVGTSENFIDGGGIIGFHLDQGRVRFEINAAVAEQVKVQLSSKLLKVANRVIK